MRHLAVLAIAACAGGAAAQNTAEPPLAEGGVLPTPRPAGRDYPPTPSVRLRLSAPRVAAGGDGVDYRIRAHNTSAAAAYHVRVRAKLPAGAKLDPEPTPKISDLDTAKRLVTWKLGTLKPGESRDVRLTIKPPAGADGVQLCAYVSFEHGQCATTRLVKPGVSLKLDAAGSAAVNESVPCRLTVTNPRQVTATDIRVVQRLPVGLMFEQEILPAGRGRGGPEFVTSADRRERTWLIGSLAPGRSRRLAFRVVGRSPGSHTMKTHISGHGLNSAKSHKLTVQDLKLDVAVEGPEAGHLGTPAKYRVLVRNLGTGELHNVRVTARLPPGTRAGGVSRGGDTFPREGEVQWMLARVKPSERRELRFSLVAARPGGHAVRVTAASAKAAAEPAVVRTEFAGRAGLDWAARATPAVARAGDEVVCEVTVKNPGTAPAAGVRLEAELPAGTEFVRSVPPATASGKGVVTLPAAALPAGGERKYVITVRAARPGGGQFRLTLAAGHLDPKKPLVRSVPVDVQ